MNDHEDYQEKKFWKLHRFREHLEKWDKQQIKYDKIESYETEDEPDVIELFKLWKTQRSLTNMAVNVSGENDFDLR